LKLFWHVKIIFLLQLFVLKNIYYIFVRFLLIVTFKRAFFVYISIFSRNLYVIDVYPSVGLIRGATLSSVMCSILTVSAYVHGYKDTGAKRLFAKHKVFAGKPDYTALSLPTTARKDRNLRRSIFPSCSLAGLPIYVTKKNFCCFYYF
jgi:hypothetical protein